MTIMVSVEMGDLRTGEEGASNNQEGKVER